MKKLKFFLFGTIFGWLVLFILIIPQYCDYRSRGYMTRWMGELMFIKPDIEAKIKSRNFDFSSITPKVRNAQTFINTDGSIIVKGNEEAYNSLLILTPQLDGDVVSWRCFGSEKNMMCSWNYLKNRENK